MRASRILYRDSWSMKFSVFWNHQVVPDSVEMIFISENRFMKEIPTLLSDYCVWFSQFKLILEAPPMIKILSFRWRFRLSKFQMRYTFPTTWFWPCMALIIIKTRSSRKRVEISQDFSRIIFLDIKKHSRVSFGLELGLIQCKNYFIIKN